MGIVIKELYKKYGGHAALDGVSLEINKGMFGLLGPNGAGKTTLMRILSTLIPPTSGTVSVNGISIGKSREIRSITGYLPQEFSFYPAFNVYEALDYLAVLSGINDGKHRKRRINELMEKVNLNRAGKIKVRALSGGMKRRLGIAQALLADPQVLIVDEPTAGLDPEERIRFRNMLGSLSAERIVLLSTHIVEDIECTCEQIAILNAGKVAYTGSIGELLKQAEGYVWSGLVRAEKLEALQNSHIVISSVMEKNGLRIRLLSGDKPFETAENVLPTIEDGYMKTIRGCKHVC